MLCSYHDLYLKQSTGAKIAKGMRKKQENRTWRESRQEQKQKHKKWLQRGLQLLVRRLKRFSSLWKAKHTLGANTRRSHTDVPMYQSVRMCVCASRCANGWACVGGKDKRQGRPYCKTNGKLLFDVVSQLSRLPSSTTMEMMGSGMGSENAKEKWLFVHIWWEPTGIPRPGNGLDCYGLKALTILESAPCCTHSNCSL